MRTVKVKSYAKVNLTLEITGVENGYHMLDSFVANIDLFDLLVIKKRKGIVLFVAEFVPGRDSDFVCHTLSPYLCVFKFQFACRRMRG